MKVRLFPRLAAILLAGAGWPAAAQTPPAPAPEAACSAPEYRQMDFWVGTWDVRWDAGPLVPAGHGTNVITREYDDCVLREAFDGGPSTGGLLGHSVSIYHAAEKRWRQTWVDNQGSYFALVGGPAGDDFVLVSHGLADPRPQGRMIFEKITPDRLTWRWQKTADGGATWTDAWVIFYERRGAQGSE